LWEISAETKKTIPYTYKQNKKAYNSICRDSGEIAKPDSHRIKCATKNCLLAHYLKSVENFKENPIREPNNFSSGDDLFVPGECGNASMSGMEKRRASNPRKNNS
jgi:hypothetical protein